MPLTGTREMEVDEEIVLAFILKGTAVSVGWEDELMRPLGDEVDGIGERRDGDWTALGNMRGPTLFLAIVHENSIP